MHTMKVGDVVMFTDEGTYAKWFYGKIGICESSHPEKQSCRVRWIEPVSYHGRLTSVSDFSWNSFDTYNEPRRSNESR
jgi:hypothetical protein